MPYDTADDYTDTMNIPYSDSSNTSSSPTTIIKDLIRTRKGSGAYRRERARELQTLPTQDLIDLVLHNEYKTEKTEARLKTYVLKANEKALAEQKALEQAKMVRQKMTQTILDTQQEVLKARQEVEQYKLKLENAQREM